MIDETWRAGFEVEVILGDLGDARFQEDVDDPMDMATPIYCQAVAKILSNLTGYKWSAPRGSPAKPGFYVIPEYDLDPITFPPRTVAGVELLTPPLPLPQAEEARTLIVDAINEIDLDGWNFTETNISENSGWHVNIDRGAERLDVEKFLLGVDELPILHDNGRLLSKCAEPQRHAYGISLLRHLQAEPSAALLKRTGLGNLLIFNAGEDKRYAANFSKLQRGYVELRHFSAGSFFSGPALSVQIQPITAAFEMGHKSKQFLEDRLIKRFQILRAWHEDLNPLLRVEMGEVGKWISITPGRIVCGRQQVAKLLANGVVEISVTGKKRYSEVVRMQGAAYSDLHETLALLALDIAELRYAGYELPTLKSSKLSSAIDQLGLALREKGLTEKVPIIPLSVEFSPPSTFPVKAS